MPNEDKLKALLADLGKATLRGVRKCPKCGTFNGTRGLSCKNKSCDVVFKEAGEKKKFTTDACKLTTGSAAQVFSVRVRDKGPDYRGFVQLPLIQGLEGDQALEGEAALIAQTAAHCYVDSCQRAQQEREGSLTLSTCHHIQAALKCATEAQPLTLKNSVLNSLGVSGDTKQAIWLLATETTGPLVQRVSKNIMVVKCKHSTKHPLGFLHFSFFETRTKEGIEHKFFCSCKVFKGLAKSSNKDECLYKRCVHFYACICAFASDDKLSDEFSYYISLDGKADPTLHSAAPHGHLVAILGDGRSGDQVEVKVFQDESAALLEATDIQVSKASSIAQVSLAAGLPIADGDSIAQVHGLETVLPTDQVQVQIHTVEGITFPEVLDPPDLQQGQKRKRQDSITQASTALITLQESTVKKSPPTKRPYLTPGKKQEPIDENKVSLTFLDWLASVTERINQTMHYQFDGHPEPLVFHAPQAFFDCVKERISSGSKKKRLPNSATGFVRKDALPLGTFTKYTWHITNILHVKQIFDAGLMPLEVTRSFVENRDGTYELYTPKEEEPEEYRKVQNQPLIKPLELKTFLKVGNTSPDQKEPTPFVIEWIPDILPQMRIGELRIKFEYGHQRNGQLEKKVCQPFTDNRTHDTTAAVLQVA